MAHRILISPLSRGLLRPCAFCIQHPRLACFLLICIVFLLTAVSAIAQTSQRVYASVPATTTTTSQVVSFTKDATGVLSLVGTPVGSSLEGGPMALDGKGQFLFVLNPTSGQISMYQIGQTVGLSEAPSSPFSANTGGVGTNSATPVCLATEKSGHFLYVGFEPTNPSANGEIVEYAIDAAAQQILMDGSIQTPPGLIDCITNQQNFLYVGLKGGGTNVYTIGQLQAAPASAGSGKSEVSIAVDPQGHFFFDGWGGSTGFVESAPISPADGSATNVTVPFSLGANNSPSSMLVDGSGKFLYVTENGSVYAYAIDAGTGFLGISPGLVAQVAFIRATSAADPQGPYIYSLRVDGVHVFEIGPDGTLAETPGSPFSTGSSGARGLAISGTSVQAVTGAVAQLFPPAQDFGSTNVGQTAGPKALTVTNTGGSPLTVTGVVVSGADAGDFVAPSMCSPQPFLPPNAGANSTCSISISFTPTATGPRQATLMITTDAAAAQSAQLTGNATAAQADITMAPVSLSFSSTLQGATSPPQTVTLTSSGAAALHISSVLLTGANANDFAMSNACSGQYPANASCTITVTFSPLGDGLRTASITVTDDAPGSTQMVQLSGTGTGAPVPRPAATITPPAAVFAAIPLGTTSPVQNVAITNSGGAALHISSVMTSGANSGDFSINNGCTGAAYAVNTACIIGITFTPSAIGLRAATLTITDDAPNSPQTVQLSGSGAGAPSVNLSSAAVSFAATALGTTSPRQNITVTNLGAAALHFSSIKLSGTNAGDFTLINECVTSAYPVNTACTVGLTFTPSATGARTATLAIADDAPNSPQTVAVTGNANSLLAVSGNLSATVTAGQTATFSLQLTAGFIGSLSSTCSGAPVSATCSVPTTTKLTSGVSVPFVITVATTGSGVSAPAGHSPADVPFVTLRLQRLPLVFLCLLAGLTLCAGAMQALGGLRRVGPRPCLAGGPFLALAGLTLCTVTGCGGGSTGAQSAPVTQSVPTPAGTSTITVSVTAATTAAAQLPPITPIQLTLTVN
jgi:hypothetical protein